jgi:hypothetical protein
MTETIPATMVAQLMALGSNLLRVAREHTDVSLEELEEEVLRVVRASQADLLEEVVTVSTTLLKAPQRARPERCPNCETWGRVQSWRSRQVVSVCGSIEYTRAWYVCPNCRKGWSPVDAILQVRPSSRVSAGLSRRLAEVGARTSFGEGAKMLESLAGLRVSSETIRQHTECLGEKIETREQEQIARVIRTRESAKPVDAAPGELVVETDGVMVRYLSGWHEVKLGVVAGYVDGELVSPSYVAARASADVFGERLLTEAARRGALDVVRWEGSPLRPGLAVLRKTVILGDGAVWIWCLADEHFGERVEIVDFYHASEHVWTVARALYGEGTADATRWANTQIHQLRERGAQPVIDALSQATPLTPESTQVVRRERGYFRTNEARMDYPRFSALGLPIGSGGVESAGKHLVQQRMKRPGARWSDNGAQHVLNVRSHLLSDLPLAS